MTAEAKAAAAHQPPQQQQRDATATPTGAGGSSDGLSRPSPYHPSPEAAFVKRYRVEIAASTSSVFSTLAAFPLDSIKTRMQTYQYKGFVDCVRHTHRTEKLGGFFRGASTLPGCCFCLALHAVLCNRRLTSSLQA